VLGDLRVRVCVDPLHPGASSFRLSTAVHAPEAIRVQRGFQPSPRPAPNIHNIVLLRDYRTTNIVLLGIIGGVTGG
jgi:hypothetical protein